MARDIFTNFKLSKREKRLKQWKSRLLNRQIRGSKRLRNLAHKVIIANLNSCKPLGVVEIKDSGGFEWLNQD